MNLYHQQVHAVEKVFSKWSNLLKKIQIVDLHVVVIVNCDLIYAEEIGSKVLKTNLVR